ncbi:MAG TPA: YqhA family protein [Anaerolineales bacterium]|nr:YqhA family protein [Anaerolineales bacterium]HNB37542.1 YqhA family protein [Anaerolineales bacterium]
MKSILERSRYLALIGIISLLVASFAAFIWGTIKTVFTTLLVIQTLGKDSTITIELIELIDIFLIATTILIFAASLYELFIGKLDMPEWMLAHDLYELKAKLSSMIVLVMAVKFLQKMIDVKDTQELLQRGIATALVSAVLIAFGYFGKKD